jgi:hypothetical protein
MREGPHFKIGSVGGAEGGKGTSAVADRARRRREVRRAHARLRVRTAPARALVTYVRGWAGIHLVAGQLVLLGDHVEVPDVKFEYRGAGQPAGGVERLAAKSSAPVMAIEGVCEHFCAGARPPLRPTASVLNEAVVPTPGVADSRWYACTCIRG